MLQVPFETLIHAFERFLTLYQFVFILSRLGGLVDRALAPSAEGRGFERLKIDTCCFPG